MARRLAHEIKNPLTPIQLSAERLQTRLEKTVDSESREFLKRSTMTIVNQVSELKGMVDEFSQYARSPSPVFESLDLNALVREVLDLYGRVKITITLDLSDQPIIISGDKSKLRQLIHNLLKNAEQAGASGDNPHVYIKTKLEKSTVSLVFQDNGIGFPPGLIARAFEPYVTTKSKGTGLGLAIVKKIVEEHYGNISIDNAKNSGAVINIVLPTRLKPK